MPLIAKAPPNTDLAVGEMHFKFGEDGTRQVTANEAEALRRYVDNGGMNITIMEQERKSTRARKRDSEV